MKDPLNDFEVVNRPKTMWISEVINAFLETGNDCMGKRFSDCKEAHKACVNVRSYIKYHGIKEVKVCKRGNMLMLMRADQ